MTETSWSQPLTRSAEDYLKTIYALSVDAPATTTEIADRLALSPASVSGMIRRLSEQRLLDHEPYRGVVLTPTGRRLALRVLRRHRLIEAYLVGFLGYRMDDVHAEADRLEHVVSDQLVERMSDALGRPRFDPHGDPIPDRNGRVDRMEYIPVPQLPVGEDVQLQRVDTSDGDRLRYLARIGLVPGALVRLVERQPFDGPLTVMVAGRERVVGHEMAMRLLCGRPAGR